jgi:amino acid adenylation domain-containing protein
MLLDSGWQGGGGLRAFCGGEALPRDLADRLLPRTAALWNLYGPTEATIWCAAEPVLPGEGRVSIGRPIANTRLLVLDRDLGLSPVGVVGELAIGGAGLARGYAGRSDLTAERFVPDPFGGGERLYRTGDLSRSLPDGRLEVLGRVDHQVKVRGFRIELQEIEAVLARHPDLREAVVLARDGRLVAFVLANGSEVTAAALRSFVGGILPEYMVPSLVVPLPAFPLTPNGKVDRKALAALSTPVFPGPDAASAAPRSPVEEVAAEIWREVLRLHRVGIDDDFFELGGHSLLATQVVSRAREAFGVDLPVKSLFEAKTLSAWAGQVDRALRAARGTVAPPIVRVPRDGDLPLSFSQEREWFLDQLEPGNAGYNLPLALRLDGRLDVAAFAAALAGVVARHESLRTTFPAVLGRPVQAIAPAASVPLPLVDLSGLPDALSEAGRLAAAEARRPFDLARGPLFRAGLLRLGETGHVALLTAHHIVTDGWSTGILLRELAALYEAARLGRPSPLPELPVQYADFAIWQRRWLAGETLASELAAWRRSLAGTPVLSLPLDRPRPAVQSFRGGRVAFAVPAALAAEVRGESRRLRSSLFMTLLGVWSALLARLSGQDDFAVGTYIANRNRAEVEGLIGFFVNNLALRAELGGDPTFTELAGRVRETTLAAYAHQDVPFEKVLEAVQPQRDLSHTPVFQVMLVLQNMPERTFAFPGLTWEPLGKNRQRSEFDLTLWLHEEQEGLRASLEYDRALFDRATVVHLTGRFLRLLAGAVREPGERLSRLPLLSAAERHQVVREWCDTASDRLAGGLLHELLEAQAARSPRALAVVSGERRMTYGELDARASRLSRRLAALGVGPEILVGLAVERSPEMIVGLLAILKAGGAYLPLDPHLPRERFALIVEDARPALVLTGERWTEILVGEGLSEAPVRSATPANLAYVLYTSGSTGRPKGVGVPHRAIASYVRAAGEAYGITAADRVLQFAALGFDTSAEEIFPCLARGATLVLRNEEMLGSVAQFLATCGAWGITVLDLPTAYWHEIAARLAAGEGELPSTLRLVVIGGERALAERLDAWRRHAGPAGDRVRLVNTYGPTEATIVATSADLAGLDDLSIGRPGANARVHLLEAALEAVPAGVPGELAIGGAGVARGYLGRPDLTAERFIPDPFAAEPGGRLYRSGDRARFLPDGALEFLGRIDDQVKIRGVRVEPGEVEASLARHPAVREAVVVAREEAPGDPRLVAYLVLGGEPHAAPAAAAPSTLRPALSVRPAPEVLELRPTVMLPRLVPVHPPAAAPAEPALPADLPPLDASLRQRVLVEWNRTASGLPKDSTLFGLFAAQAARTPEAVALCWRGQRLSYRELARRAGRLAGHLRRLGVGPEVPVGVCFDRCMGMVVALLGTLRAGGLYVPLDPAYPRERLAFTLEDSQAGIVLAQEHLLGLLPSTVGPVVLDDQGEGAFPGGPWAPAADAVAANLAYLIYTSGSTGRPKGVAITHRSATTLLHWARGIYGPEDLAGVLASTSICFDLSVFELFLPLAWGGTVHLAQNALELPQLPTASEVTLINTVPSAISELVRTGSVPASVRTVCLAGEPLRGALVRRIYAPGTVEGVWNLYGPSEDTTYSTWARIARDASREPAIGRPIADTRAYLLGAEMEPVPVGAPGELYLGGDGLARGYLGRPELTAERFVPDPFAGPGSRLYRTGDLARYREDGEDGEIEFLGRIDHQVKVRGFRIELGEIEAQLLAHPAVHDAVAVVREVAAGEGTDRRIVAYVVLQGELRAADLRVHLREKLPEHMVPSGFVVLGALPLTPNGKVDRRALPEPDWEAGEAVARVAPRNPVEARLAEVWSEVLGLAHVGVEDGFFDLGGHSMSGTQILSRVHEVFGVALPLKLLFAAPTIAGLAARLALARGEQATDAGPAPLPPIVPVPHDGEVELSFLQEAMWFLDRIDPGSSAYNIPMALRFRGPLDRPALERSLDMLVSRHEALRTLLVDHDHDRGPVQAVLPGLPAALPLVDLAALPAAAGAAAAVRLAAEEASRPFHLGSRAPLFRLALLRLETREHLLLLSLHHTIADGWSVSVLLQELMTLYTALAAGEPPPLPEPPPLQFSDFSRWQRRVAHGPEMEPQVAYWRERLAGGPEPLDLSTDRPRPPVQTFAGGWQPLAVPAPLRAELWRLARRLGATPFAALLAACQALLGRLTGQEDFAIGSPVANRNRVESEGLVGCVTNSLVLRSDLASGPSAGELLVRAAETAFGAFAHQDLPFERMLEELQPERDLSRSPLFQAMLIYQNLTRSVPCPPGLDVELLEAPNGGAKLDLLLAFAEGPEGLSGGLEYNQDLFDAVTAARMAGSFLALLAGFVERPERPVPELPLLSAGERHQLAVEWNDTAAPWAAGEACLHELVAAQARRTPESVAVVFEGTGLTYRELDLRANQLAWRLRRLGVGPETLVAIAAERSLEMMVALLGVLKSGGAWVPLDPSYPEVRLASMLADSEAAVLLAQKRLLPLVPAPPGLPVLPLDGCRAFADEPTGPPATGVLPDNAAYMIYTSGSTGRPKGAVNSHRGIVNRMLWMLDAFPLGADERVLQKTPFSFDVSIWELFCPLLLGARLVMARPGGHQDSAYLVRLIAEERVTTSHFVPSMLGAFLEEPDLDRCGSLRRVLTSGEALPFELQELFHRRLGAELHNFYGPTEAAVEVTAWACEREPRRRAVPIGRPIGNVRIHVLGPGGEPVPIGAKGELFIGGVAVARGYWGRPDRTAEKFVPDPFAPGARLYRSGDVARILPDGAVEYVGRVDHQVKIRGVRIELGEVEAALRRSGPVREALVALLPDGAGSPRLVGYVVPADAAPELDLAGLRRRLALRLPEPMIPAVLVPLAALPLTASGKVDRRALPAPAWVKSDAQDVEPRDAVEELLAGIWSELLGAPRVGAFDNFFDLGGHSLTGTRLASRIREIFKVEMPPQRLFEQPTLAALAAWIKRESGRSTAVSGRGAPPLLPVPRGGDLPASFGQERLWFLDRLYPGSPAYNVASAVRLTGRLSVAALAASLDVIVRRHEALRTVFAERGGLVQVVREPCSTHLPVVDLQQLPDAHGAAVALAREEARRPFDLERGPLVRFTLLRIGELDSALLATLHHIVSDGWSLQVFFRELAALYRAAESGVPARLPELPVQYADHADWQRRWLAGEVLEAELAFWRERLAGAPALLDLPTDRPRPAVQSLRGGLLPLTVPAGVAGKVKELSRRSGATLFMTLLAAFQALLARFSGEAHIPVGTPVAGRTRPEIENLIGFFVNTLVLSTDLSGDPSFAEGVKRVRAMALEAYAHQELPLDRLVAELRPERTASHAPLVQVMFVVQNAQRAGRGLPGLTLGPLDAERKAEVDGQTSKLDITLSLTEAPDGSLLGRWEYSRDLFDEATVRQLDANFLRLVESAAGEPGRRLSQVDLLWEGERHQVRAAADPLAGIDLRAFLRGRLPEAMIPWVFVVLPALPLLPSGKVDRRALPAPEPPRGDEGAFVPPRTETEELVAEVWAQVLGIERIGAYDRFFDIGGQSLLATQVVSRLRRELGLDIPLRTLFEAPTLEGFAYALEDLLLAAEEPPAA